VSNQPTLPLPGPPGARIALLVHEIDTRVPGIKAAAREQGSFSQSSTTVDRPYDDEIVNESTAIRIVLVSPCRGSAPRVDKSNDHEAKGTILRAMTGRGSLGPVTWRLSLS